MKSVHCLKFTNCFYILSCALYNSFMLSVNTRKAAYTIFKAISMTKLRSGPSLRASQRTL